MPRPQEELARSLEYLRELQIGGRSVFQSDELNSTHRTRLTKNGFLEQIIRGWWMSTESRIQSGDSTPWYASFWEFCTHYCRSRFGDDWHLTAEQSIMLHAARRAVPRQVIINATKGANNNLALPYETSLYDLKTTQVYSEQVVEDEQGVRLLNLPFALIKASPSFMHDHASEVQVAIASIEEVDPLLRLLLEGEHNAIAGRLAGAFNQVGRPQMAQRIEESMKAAGYEIRITNPFDDETVLDIIPRRLSPLAARLHALWHGHRSAVHDNFPPPSHTDVASDEYLRNVDEVYTSDAYHSLSIEGYQVSEELIERVRSGSWDPEVSEGDKKDWDALAARGYWEAFQAVKEDVALVLEGHDAGRVVRESHQSWYVNLFGTFVRAGMTQPTILAGYRDGAVYIRNSRHVPCRREAVPDGMRMYFDLIAEESATSVRVVLGHWLFGYIHPYSDGNGRMARFMMNVLLAGGGYPWTVIRKEVRDAYMAALESASIDYDLVPLTKFISSQMVRSAK